MDSVNQYQQELKSLEHENNLRQARAQNAKISQNSSFVCGSVGSPCLLDTQLQMLRRNMTSESDGGKTESTKSR